MTNIMLVEDDLEICEILQFYLMEKEDYQVTVAHSAEQALPLVRMRRFDLVLLDIMLQGMGGDDYLVKPFQASVLLARIEANLRRCRMSHEESPQLTVGELVLNRLESC